MGRIKGETRDLPIPEGERPQEAGQVYTLPTSPATYLINQVLAYGDNIEDLPNRYKSASHSASVQVSKRGKGRQIQYKKSGAEISIELPDINKLAGGNAPAKRLFALALIKAREQALHNGALGRDYVTMPLKELIDKGMYKTVRSARQGFNSGADALTSLKVKGHAQRGKKKISSDVLEVLFTGARIENGVGYLFLNDRINWSFVTQFYTPIPGYYFKLRYRAGDLLYYMFYLARQHAKVIEAGKSFSISFRSIQMYLQLPSEIDNPNPARTIREPIEQAIEAIEEAHSAEFNNMDLQLLPVYPEECSIKEFLDKGYLKVTIAGELAASFIDISKKTARIIEQSRKRKEKIEDAARAENLAKKMEREESAGRPDKN